MTASPIPRSFDASGGPALPQFHAYVHGMGFYFQKLFFLNGFSAFVLDALLAISDLKSLRSLREKISNIIKTDLYVEASFSLKELGKMLRYVAANWACHQTSLDIPKKCRNKTHRL